MSHDDEHTPTRHHNKKRSPHHSFGAFPHSFGKASKTSHGED